eukprot:573147-Pelagomonas_calceolata.AAC.9
MAGVVGQLAHYEAWLLPWRGMALILVSLMPHARGCNTFSAQAQPAWLSRMPPSGLVAARGGGSTHPCPLHARGCSTISPQATPAWVGEMPTIMLPSQLACPCNAAHATMLPLYP